MTCSEKKRFRTLEDAQSAAAWNTAYFNDGVTLSAYECPEKEYRKVPKTKWSHKTIRQYLPPHYHLTKWESTPARADEAVVRGAKLLRLEQLMDKMEV